MTTPTNVILVCGGRHFRDHQLLEHALQCVNEQRPISLLVHGGSDGADTMAGTWAVRHDIDVRMYRALWDRFGKAAGYRRNETMLADAKPDLVVAFDGGRAVGHLVQLALEAGIQVWEVSHV